MARRRGQAVANRPLDPVDRIYLARACELAARGRGSTAPNPCVGAVVVGGTRTLGEGFHAKRGEPHAETVALIAAGEEARGATLYVTLEPCAHHGLTPPCAHAVVAAGIARVVIGALDPNPRTAGRGVALLREAGIETLVAGDEWSSDLIEDFAIAIRRERPYVRLKLAASLDGYVAPQPGPYWLTGEDAREYVRELRSRYDAVLVGAGTVRVDDPQLTVRPPRSRRKPYVRVIACEEAPVPLERKVFAEVAGYARTIVLAPAGRRETFEPLAGVAHLLLVGPADSQQLDLAAALVALKEHGIASLLCEGGPTLAARLLARGLVDRLDWLSAPVLLANPHAVPALASGDVRASHAGGFDRIERLGDDLLVSLRFAEGA